MEFVTNSGNNTYAFVAFIAQLLVNEKGHLRSRDEQALAQDLDGSPEAGEYVFVPDTNDTSFTECPGPEGKHMKRALPTDDDGASSASHSSRSSMNQTRFRELLMMRDGGDYFSRQPGPLCVAANLVPQSRPDLYKDLLDDDYQFDVSHGLFMDSILHTQYDHYKWSIYFHQNRYYFHAFDATAPYIKSQHGKSFSTTDVRYLAPPDPILCSWHYRQCVLKYVRAYSVGMAVNAF
ncbi:hypothetical protein JCM11641_002045 [Rhodosporidiobolus odoratus]